MGWQSRNKPLLYILAKTLHQKKAWFFKQHTEMSGDRDAVNSDVLDDLETKLPSPCKSFETCNSFNMEENCVFVLHLYIRQDLSISREVKTLQCETIPSSLIPYFASQSGKEETSTIINVLEK